MDRFWKLQSGQHSFIRREHKVRGAGTGSETAYRAGLYKFRIGVLIDGGGSDLQDDLDEAARKVFDKNELSQRLLQ